MIGEYDAGCPVVDSRFHVLRRLYTLDHDWEVCHALRKTTFLTTRLIVGFRFVSTRQAASDHCSLKVSRQRGRHTSPSISFQDTFASELSL